MENLGDLTEAQVQKVQVLAAEILLGSADREAAPFAKGTFGGGQHQQGGSLAGAAAVPPCGAVDANNLRVRLEAQAPTVG